MKIFGLGLSKTGTTSLAKALELLGFRVDHRGRVFVDRPPEQLLDLDGATDELATCYALLDQRYPGAKFILTVRELDGWLKSCSHHFRQPLEPGTWGTEQIERLYGTTVFDPQKFAEGYGRHQQAVLDYFRDRPADLLVIDISAGEGWERLCPFLGRPIPKQPFPRENVSRSWSRVLRKVRSLWRTG